MSKSVLAPLFSLAATATLFLLLRRTMASAEAPPGWLAPGVITSFQPMELALLGGTLLACSWAVLRQRRDVLLTIHLAVLAAGLLLTQYRLGAVPTKIDLRFVLSVLTGIATLDAGCLCLLAHAALWARQRWAPLVNSAARE